VPAVRRLLIAPIIIAAALGLAACSSSSSSTTPESANSAGAAATSQLPAVGNATDLKKEPTIGPGMPPPPTTLVTRDLVVGTGPAASASNTVVVQYVGADYANGETFDASWQDNGPATFPLSEVVPGFAQGIVGMKVGGRREIVIPPALGYGAAGKAPAVAGNETLVFVVDLLSVQ
jgi:peptidylprolyl isomerase